MLQKQQPCDPSGASRDSEPAGRDRRKARRVDVELDVDYTAEDTYLMTDSASITNLSSLGIFIRTNEPEPVGTEIKMRFTPHGVDEPIQVAGEVVWVNEPSEGADSSDVGMGVRFVNLDSELRDKLVAMIRRVALLVD